jgi:hypothetical protein
MDRPGPHVRLALSDGVRPLPVSGKLFPFAPATIDSHPFASRSDILKSGAMARLPPHDSHFEGGVDVCWEAMVS